MKIWWCPAAAIVAAAHYAAIVTVAIHVVLPRSTLLAKADGGDTAFQPFGHEENHDGPGLRGTPLFDVFGEDEEAQSGQESAADIEESLSEMEGHIRDLKALGGDATIDQVKVADLFVDTIKTQLKTITDIEEVLVVAFDKLLGNATDEEEAALNGTNLMDLVFNNKTTFDAVNDAMTEATNHSFCDIPHTCDDKDKEKLQIIKKYLSHKLKEFIRDTREPTMTALYETIEDDTGIDAETVEELIEGDKAIQRHLKKKVKDAMRQVKKDEAKSFAELVENMLVTAGNNHNELEDVIKDAPLTEEMIEGASRALDKEHRKKVVHALKKPHEELAEQIRIANIETGNSTGQASEEAGGRRALHYLLDPNKLTIEEQQEQIAREIEERRLARAAHLRDADAFEKLFTDHIGELHGHIAEVHSHRALSETSGTRWIADNLEDVTDLLSDAGGKVLKALVPFKHIMNLARIAQSILWAVDKVAKGVMWAINALVLIPKVGLVFAPVQPITTQISTTLTAIDSKASLFMKTIGTFWDLSVGSVELVIASFDDGVASYTARGAELVADISQSQCSRNLAQKVAGGVDILGGIEATADLVRKAVESLMRAIKPLLAAFGTTLWKEIEDIFEAIGKVLEPIQIIFKPFELLQELVNREITVPWFKPPYIQTNFGESRCNPGYGRGKINKLKCWEQNSPQWEYIGGELIPYMRRTCSSGNLEGHPLGNCWNKGYARGKKSLVTRTYCAAPLKWSFILWKKTCYLKDRRVSITCPSGYVKSPTGLACFEACRAGYETTVYYCRPQCPSGFTPNLAKDVCIKGLRKQQSSWANCDAYQSQARQGTRAEPQAITGNCVQSCESGHTKVLGFCYPPSTETISIAKIMDPFSLLLKYIKNTDLYQTITAAIEKEVKKVLHAVYSEVQAWLDKYTGFKLPDLPKDFPNFSKGLFPFDLLESIGIKFPAAPDFDKLAKLPAKAFKDVIKGLPAPANQLAECDDAKCMLSKVGLDDAAKLVDPVASLINILRDVDDMFIDMVTGLECSKWGSQTVPMTDLITKLGLDLPDDVCDVEVPYCEGLDLSQVVEPIQKLTDRVRPVIEELKAVFTGSGRRLEEKTEEYFWPIAILDLPMPPIKNWKIDPLPDQGFSVAVLPGAFSEKINDLLKSASKKMKAPLRMKFNKLMEMKEKADEAMHPFGLNFEFKAKLFVEFGLLHKTNGLVDWPGIKFGTKLETEVGVQFGAKVLLIRAIGYAKELQPFEETRWSKVDPPTALGKELKAATKKCGLDGFDATLRGGTWDENESKFLAKVCKGVKAAKQEARESTDYECSSHQMDSLKGLMSDFLNKRDTTTKTAEKCISYWTKKHGSIKKKVTAYSNKKRAYKRSGSMLKGKSQPLVAGALSAAGDAIRFIKNKYLEDVKIPFTGILKNSLTAPAAPVIANLINSANKDVAIALSPLTKGATTKHLPEEWQKHLSNAWKQVLLPSTQDGTHQLYRSDKTKGIKSWKQADDFCKSEGHKQLATKDAICKNGTPVSLFGQVEGDSWAPIADNVDGWVHVGKKPNAKLCETGKADDIKNVSWQNTYIMCEKQHTLYGPDKTGGVQNWKQAEEFCRAKGHKQLATEKAYCNGGGALTWYGGSTPSFKQQDGDQWAPIKDYKNGWIQVGGPKEPENIFLVIQNGAVKGKEANLDKAKALLQKHASGSRLIVEVKQGKVSEDPHTIAGQDQTTENGFAMWWSGWSDINKQVVVAKEFVKNANAEKTNRLCRTHRKAGHGDPVWGEDKAKAAYEANYILCEGSKFLMFDKQWTTDVMNWNQAEGFCKSKGYNLATQKGYCHGGGGTPYFGQMEGDQWAPIGDYVNGWVQVGKSSHGLCKTHREIAGDPDWGRDNVKVKASYEANYIVCMTVPTPKTKKSLYSKVMSHSSTTSCIPGTSWGEGEDVGGCLFDRLGGLAFSFGMGIKDEPGDFEMIPTFNILGTGSWSVDLQGGIKPVKLLKRAFIDMKAAAKNVKGANALKGGLKSLFHSHLDNIKTTKLVIKAKAEFSMVFDPIGYIVNAVKEKEKTAQGGQHRQLLIVDTSLNKTQVGDVSSRLAQSGTLPFAFPPSIDPEMMALMEEVEGMMAEEDDDLEEGHALEVGSYEWTDTLTNNGGELIMGGHRELRNVSDEGSLGTDDIMAEFEALFASSQASALKELEAEYEELHAKFG